MLCEMLLYAIGLIVVTVLALIIYARWHYGELEKLGIPVVKPHWFFGSNPNFNTVIGHELDVEWLNKYGDVFGVYEGRDPQIHITDADLVRQIFIKNFDSFENRKPFDVGANASVEELMDNLTGEKWKVVRSHMSPAFTTSKLKKMSVIMKDVAQEFVDRIKKDIKDGNGVSENANISTDVFCALTDLVARCTLNIKIDNPRDPENAFAKGLKQLWDFLDVRGLLLQFQYTLPHLVNAYRRLTQKDLTSFFDQVFRSVMAERRKSGEKKNDFMDFLMENCEKTKTEEFKKLGITEKTLMAQGIEFFVAGQDSMSTAISFLTYYISRPEYEDVERKLYAEIDDYLEKHERISHETFGDLPYLNACLNETLRLHPTFIKIDRQCNKDWEYKGLKIKKGTTVVLPIWSYNRNPKYFEDPDTFNPERFMSYNKDKLNPVAVGTFGHGPRVCPGKMFSFECMMIVAVHLLSQFKFKTKLDATVNYIPGMPLVAMADSLTVDIVERKNDN